ncbi:MAG: ABC transporter permease subunit [Clostridium sp.]|nr:ABC transporter permease subunit [Clostridium sp.]
MRARENGAAASANLPLAPQKMPVFVKNSLALLLVLFGCFVIYPLLCMFSMLRRADIASMVQSGSFRRALSATLLSAVLVTVFSVAAALLMAFLLCRTSVKGRKLWMTLFLMPMLIPSVSHGTGLVLLLGNNGIVTKLLHLPGNIYGMQGIVLGQFLYTAPAAFLLLYHALEEENYTPHEAAMVLGIPKAQRFRAITLPYMRRDLIAAAFLVFSMSVTDYGIPLSVGGKTETLAVVMYQKVAGRLQFDKGSFIGLLLLLPAVLSFLADSRRNRRVVPHSIRFPEVKEPVRDSLAFTGCLLITAVLVMPILAFTTVMFMEDYPRSLAFTTAHLSQMWSGKGLAGLRSSALMAAGGAFFGTAAAVFAAYAASRTEGVLSRGMHMLSLMVLSVPGLVLGLSYAMAFRTMPFYGTIGLMAISCSIHFFTTPYLMLYQAFSRFDRDLEATGRLLGIPPFRLFTDVMLPQCRGELLDMLSFFFVNSMVTISAVVFLAKAQNRPLSLLITQYNDQLNLEGAAVLSFLILAVNFTVRTVLLGMRKGRR